MVDPCSCQQRQILVATDSLPKDARPNACSFPTELVPGLKDCGVNDRISKLLAAALGNNQGLLSGRVGILYFLPHFYAQHIALHKIGA